MSSTARMRFSLCALVIASGTTLGCGQPSRNEPAGGEARVEPQEQVTAEIAPVETVPEAPEIVEVANSLGIGDPAPQLAINRWVTGEPIESLDAGQVYVVEFWATWCGPCRTSMPHLSQLQQQYGEQVRFVGVTREKEDTVQAFLGKEQSAGKTWQEVIQYRLAIDANDATNNAYMRAAGQTGIPSAFIVGKQGLVEWIGHPMTMDGPLAQVVDGSWDREAAIAESRQKEKMKAAASELNSLIGAGEWDRAIALLDQLANDTGPSTQLSKTKLSILQAAGRGEAAAKLQTELVDQLWDEAMELNEIAWNIATGSVDRDLALAHKAAQRASELRNHEDAAILDTLARVYYERGELDEAIKWQKKACEHNTAHRGIDATLKKYEAEKASPSEAPAAEPATAAAAGEDS